MPVSYLVFAPLILCLVLNALPSRLMAQQPAPVPDAPAGEAAKKAGKHCFFAPASGIGRPNRSSPEGWRG